MHSLIVACIAYMCKHFPLFFNIKDVSALDTVTAIRNRLLQLCAQRNISINRLANLSALPPSSIKNILYGKSRNPKVETIKMMCDGLGITLGEFFSTREFDELEQSVR